MLESTSGKTGFEVLEPIRKSVGKVNPEAMIDEPLPDHPSNE